jgi:hypothetical protein
MIEGELGAEELCCAGQDLFVLPSLASRFNVE